MKFISIIIPVLNEGECLRERLSALQELRDAHCEIIVVDGGSSDGTAQIALSIADTFISVDRGRANQMNAGAKKAKGELLLFLHSDTLLPKIALEELRVRVGRNQIYWGWFDLRFTNPSLIFSIISKSMLLRSSLTNICTGDQTLFVSSQVFDDVGGFPNIPLMEDIALSKVLKARLAPTRINSEVISSSRRWENQGILRTISLMWWLRFQYWIGVDPSILADLYYPDLSVSEPETVRRKQAFRFPQISILLFARTPELGKVKTRLQTMLGPEKTLSLHKAMFNRIFEVIKNSRLAETQLWVTSNGNEDYFVRLAGGDNVFIQAEGNLGDKMISAITQTLRWPDIKAVVVLGSDCPAVTKDYLNRALSHLQSGSKLVLGPAEDGGYVLIGMSSSYSQLFEEIEWGSDQVFIQTVKKAESIGLEYVTLETLWDVDRPQDLVRLNELSPPLIWGHKY